MNEERLNELEKRVSFYQDDMGNDYFEGPLECKDLQELIAAARRCAELEAVLERFGVLRMQGNRE